MCQAFREYRRCETCHPSRQFAVHHEVFGLIVPDCRRRTNWRPTVRTLQASIDAGGRVFGTTRFCADCACVYGRCCDDMDIETQTVSHSRRGIVCRVCSTRWIEGPLRYYPQDASWTDDVFCRCGVERRHRRNIARRNRRKRIQAIRDRDYCWLLADIRTEAPAVEATCARSCGHRKSGECTECTIAREWNERKLDGLGCGTQTAGYSGENPETETFEARVREEWLEKTALGKPVLIELGDVDYPSESTWMSLPWGNKGVATHGTMQSGRRSMLLGSGKYCYGVGQGRKTLVGQAKPKWFLEYESIVRAWAEAEGLPVDDKQWELALVNWYFGGANISKHSDNEPEIDQSYPIVSHSHGDEVTFCYRNRGMKKAWEARTSSDRLIVMPAGVQKHSEHWTQSVGNKPQFRINVTWRAYKPVELSDAQKVRQVSENSPSGGASIGEGVRATPRSTLPSEDIGWPKNKPSEGIGAGSQGREEVVDRENQGDPPKTRAEDPSAVPVKDVPVPAGTRYNTAAIGVTDDSSHKPLLPLGWEKDLEQYLRMAAHGTMCTGAMGAMLGRKAMNWLEATFDLHGSGVVNNPRFCDAVGRVVAHCHGEIILNDTEANINVAREYVGRWKRANLWLKHSVLECGGMPWWMGAAFVGACVGLTVYTVHYRLSVADLIFRKLWAPIARVGPWKLSEEPTKFRCLMGVLGLGRMCDRLAVVPTQSSKAMQFLKLVGAEGLCRRLLGSVRIPTPQMPRELYYVECGTAGLVSMCGSLKILSGFKTYDDTVIPTPNAPARSSRA